MAVNINKASADELMEAIPELGGEWSQKIVAYREENGPFESWDDLKNISGIDDQIVETVKRNTEM